MRIPATLAFVLAAVSATGAVGPHDPLADDIARWAAFLRDHPAAGDDWNDVKATSEPVIAKAQDALAGGRRLLALDRLAVVRTQLAATRYVDARPAGERKDVPAFEAEWSRMGRELADALGRPSPDALQGAPFAAARAEGEAALLQVRGFYESSLDYGRATMAEAGLFYLGSARAQREFAAFCRTLPRTEPGRPPALRSIAPELDALTREFLAAYKPPASIDKHTEFIIAHSLLNEARGLDEAGLRYGAVLRYLQAAMRSGSLRGPVPAIDTEALDATLGAFDARLAEPGVDHTLGRLFVEAARANPADLAPVIVADVLPRYLAALAPAPAAAKRPAPQVTVTLVRWPYT